MEPSSRRSDSTSRNLSETSPEIRLWIAVGIACDTDTSTRLGPRCTRNAVRPGLPARLIPAQIPAPPQALPRALLLPRPWLCIQETLQPQANLSLRNNPGIFSGGDCGVYFPLKQQPGLPLHSGSAMASHTVSASGVAGLHAAVSGSAAIQAHPFVGSGSHAAGSAPRPTPDRRAEHWVAVSTVAGSHEAGATLHPGFVSQAASGSATHQAVLSGVAGSHVAPVATHAQPVDGSGSHAAGSAPRPTPARRVEHWVVVSAVAGSHEAGATPHPGLALQAASGSAVQ